MTGTAGAHPAVLVGVDGSSEAKAATAWAADYVRGTGGSLELLAAWHWPVAYGYPMTASGYDPEDAARTVVAEAAAELALPAEQVRTTVVSGAAAQALVKASTHADLLVVGSRGLGGFSGLLLGSVGSFCVHHAACPVLVHRPSAEPSPSE